MKTSKWTGTILLAAIFVTALYAMAVDKPFPGRYMLMGDSAQLLEGDNLLVEDFISPTCPSCYLFWENHKPFGGDVVEKRYYVFQHSHGYLPISMLLVARGISPEMEEKLLNALFKAKFVGKVNIEDEEILDAIAQSIGMGDPWKKKKDSEELKAEMKKLEEFLAERGVERTPRIIVQHVAVHSPKISGCRSEEMDNVINETLDNLRRYRQEHGR